CRLICVDAIITPMELYTLQFFPDLHIVMQIMALIRTGCGFIIVSIVSLDLNFFVLLQTLKLHAVQPEQSDRLCPRLGNEIGAGSGYGNDRFISVVVRYLPDIRTCRIVVEALLPAYFAG